MSGHRPSPPPPASRSAPPVRLPPPPPRAGSTAPPVQDRPTELLPPRDVRPVVALAVTGSVAAYKAAIVARLLVKAGARVIPVMTRSACEFLGRATLAGITGERVRDDMFEPGAPGELHVDLGSEADMLVIAPATADVLARMAAGRADDLVTALALCARGPVLVAPAMHPRMWAHPATQRNVAALVADGRVELVGPVDGEVASGERGVGRMADPETIAAAALARAGRRDLVRLRVVVTAGPTVEDFDPVRFIGNRSSGKMGFAIAERAASRGAIVTLIAGPVQLPTPYGVRRIDVRSALSMQSALAQTLGPDLGGADALVMAAAVSDYRPAEEHASKLRRTAEPMTIELVPNPDILAEIGAVRTGRSPVLVGFAVETASEDRVLASARSKLETKRVDMVVANHASDAFGRDDNRVILVTREGAETIGTLPKTHLADAILDRVAALCAER